MPARRAVVSVIALIVFVSGGAALRADPPAPPAAAAAAPVYNEKADANVDIAHALAKAKRNHSRVLIQWGANWCGWCKLLHKLSRDDAAIKKTLQSEYEVVLVDMGRMDKHVDLAEKYGAALKTGGLPYLTVLDENGTVVVNQETGSLERKGDGPPSHDPALVLAFLKRHQAIAPKAEDVLAAGTATAATEGKRVFLHFGAPSCDWCHKLDDWMAKPAIAAILAKEFVYVKVDTERMPGGQALLTKHRRSAGDTIPWIAFLAGDGTALTTSTGPTGNVGFPAQPDEIAWFVEMLRTGAVRLTAEDIAALEASLKAN